MIYYVETGTDGAFSPILGYRCQAHLQASDLILKSLPQGPEYEADTCDVCRAEAADPGRIPATREAAQTQREAWAWPRPTPWSWLQAEEDRQAALRLIANLPGPATREQLERAGLPARHLPATPVIPTPCPHCGWDHPGSGTCPDCREFLETGIDPRPFCERCGRSVPAGRVCPCGDDLLGELAEAAGRLAEGIRLLAEELSK